jgi:hypothetical protein
MDSHNTFDVLVVGGGVTGFVAATSASRNGAKTLLIERDGALGGTMTNGMVGPMMTFHSDKEQLIKGIPQEVIDRLMEIQGSPGHIKNTMIGETRTTITPFGSEAFKLIAQRMVLESGAKILLNSWVQDVILEQNTLRGVTVLNKGGTETFFARVLIDATGDADVAFRSGASWTIGRTIDHRVQPVSLMFKVGPVDVAALRDHITNHPGYFLAHEGFYGLAVEGIKAITEQSHFAVGGDLKKILQSSKHNFDSSRLPDKNVLFFTANDPQEVIINMSRITIANPLDPWELTEAELEGREQMFAIMSFLKEFIPGFKTAHILAAGNRVGIRESRRIIGEYILTAEDVLHGNHFPDAVMRNAYPIDIHPPTPGEAHDARHLKPGEYYEVPYRCLVPLKVEQLLVAGRCISATHEAQGSIRTSPACMALGQAAGTAAALSAKEETSPRSLETGFLQQILRLQGVNI